MVMDEGRALAGVAWAGIQILFVSVRHVVSSLSVYPVCVSSTTSRAFPPCVQSWLAENAAVALLS